MKYNCSLNLVHFSNITFGACFNYNFPNLLLATRINTNIPVSSFCLNLWCECSIWLLLHKLTVHWNSEYTLDLRCSLPFPSFCWLCPRDERLFLEKQDKTPQQHSFTWCQKLIFHFGFLQYYHWTPDGDRVQPPLWNWFLRRLTLAEGCLSAAQES